MKEVTFTVLENLPLAPRTFRMKLGGDTSAIRCSGEFVQVAVEGKFLRRPISVHDCDWETLTLVYKVVGEGTAALSAKRPGDRVCALTGLGNSFDIDACSHKALLLGGGLSGVTGLEEGEGGYFGDMLSLYDAAGMSAPDFRDHLAVNGIDMQTQVSLTFTSIHGSAPSSKLPSLLKALLALANNRTVNRGEFEIYLRNAAWARESVEDRLYKMMYPGFSYTSRKYPSALGQATQAKAAQFWESRFSRVNDGMLVIVGDVDEATVRKDLLKYIGGFRTQRGAESRKAVRYTPVSGGTQKGSEGEKGAYVRLDAEFPLSGVNYVMAEVGADVLRRHVVAALQGTGLSTEVTTGFHSYPQERLWMVVSCEGKKASAALPAIREGIRKAAAATVSQKDVNAYKAMVLSDMNRELTAPETVVSAVVARYGIGKDMVSHYKESVNGITPASLKEMLSALASGRTAEYVVE